MDKQRKCPKCGSKDFVTHGKVTKCRPCYNEYMRVYMADRYQRRHDYIMAKLGGRCARCNSTEELQIDHVDQYTKNFDIGKRLAGIAEARLQDELKKCQILCKTCHDEKSRQDRAHRFNQRVRWEHGTLGGYRYCRCDLCKKAQSEYCKEYRKKKKNLPR